MHKVFGYCVLFALIAVVVGETGICSWYSGGGMTASGEPFVEDGMTAAHKTLPFNSTVKVDIKDKSVEVRINDRAAFPPGRILVLSKGAADKLNLINLGIANCTVTPV